MPQPSAPQPVRHLNLTRVDLLEVDALYDLRPGQSIEAWCERSAVGTLRWYDLSGQFVSEPDLHEGMYCGYISTGSPKPFSRTFNRRLSRPVRSKWAYVFASTLPDHKDARLLHELFFDHNGTIYETDPSHHGRQDRALAPKPIEFLGVHLEQPQGKKWKELQHFFLLAPRQLPWPAIENILTDVAAHATFLKDDFFADVCLPDLPNDRLPLVKAIANGLPDDGHLRYVLHLVDPIKEALLRRERLIQVRTTIEAHQSKKHEDREYLLARRIYALTSRRPDLWSQVGQRLTDHLLEKDEITRRLFLIQERLAGDLIRWIGEGSQRAPLATARAPDGSEFPVTVYYQDGKHLFSLPPAQSHAYQPISSGQQSIFCNLVNCYRDAALSDWNDVAVSVTSLHQVLNECHRGREWLSANLDSFRGTPSTPFDGGIGIVVDIKKPLSIVLSLAVGAYSSFWAKRFKEKALSSLSEWLKARWGTQLRLVSRSDRLAIKAAERGALKAARKIPLDRLELRPNWVETANVSQDVIKFFDLGLKAVNAANALEKMASTQMDGWRWASAIADVVDAYDALRSAQKTAIAIELYDKFGEARSIGPLSVATGIVSALSDFHSMTNAHTASDRAGFAVATIGSSIAVAGPLLVTGAFPLAFLGFVVFCIQATGRWIRSDFDALSRFARYCQFASGNGLADFFDCSFMHRGPPYWYSHDLSKLATDVEGEHRALDEVLNNFCPRLTNDGNRLRLEVETTGFGPITLHSTWTAIVTTPLEGLPPKIASYRPILTIDGENQHYAWADLERFDQPRMGAPQPASTDPQSAPTARTSGHAVAEVTFDLLGDGTMLFKRSCREEFTTPGNSFAHELGL